MEELLRNISKPLRLLEKAGVLVALIFKMMAGRLTTEKVGVLLTENALARHHFLPEDQNFGNFVSARCNLHFERREIQSEGGENDVCKPKKAPDKM